MKSNDRDRILQIMDAVGRVHRLVALGRLDEAFEILGVLGVSAEEAPGAIYLRASVAMWARRWPDAVPLLESLLRMAPEHAEVRVGEARLRTTPEDEAIRLELARCLIESGRLDEARAALEGEDHPPDGDECVLLAWIAAQQGQPALAIVHLETAGRLDAAAWSTALGCPGLAALIASLN